MDTTSELAAELSLIYGPVTRNAQYFIDCVVYGTLPLEERACLMATDTCQDVEELKELAYRAEVEYADWCIDHGEFGGGNVTWREFCKVPRRSSCTA